MLLLLFWELDFNKFYFVYKFLIHMFSFIYIHESFIYKLGGSYGSMFFISHGNLVWRVYNNNHYYYYFPYFFLFYMMLYKWKHLSLSELTPIIFDMELTLLSSN